MLQRNSTGRKEPTTALRRSPRLLQTLRSEQEDPKTPNPTLRSNWVSHSDLSSLSSTRRVSLKKARQHFPEIVAKNVKESDFASRIPTNSTGGLRRSARLNVEVEGFCFLRRSHRFSVKGNTDGCVEMIGQGKSNQEGLSYVGKAEVGIDSRKRFLVKTEKRVTRSSSQGEVKERVEKTVNDECNRTIECTSTELSTEEILSDVEGTKAGANPCEKFVVKLEKRKTCSSITSSAVIEGRGEERKIGKGRKTGVRRKRNQVGEDHVINQGWTRDQELALQRAYLVAKPTPHFWKKVAKLVPGKSAQDCFDKVHSDHLTPLQPRPRSRANKKNSSSLSFSASKLLTSEEPKTKRRSCSKQKSHLVQKTARHLLQKHYQVDQDYEVDLFSVLESNLNPSTHACQQSTTLFTPECGKERSGFLKICERSSSARKKHLSILGSLSGATLGSPPVLKQVKNKALHEKYIDQLHCREAKRKAASARAAKSVPLKEDKELHIQKVDAIKAAKSALVFEARDVIDQFQHSQANAIGNTSDIDDYIDGDGDSDDDEGEG